MTLGNPLCPDRSCDMDKMAREMGVDRRPSAELSSEFWINNERIEALKQLEFSRLKGVTYLDHAGTTLYAESQIRGYHDDLLSGIYGNPHSGNQSSQTSVDIIEQVRYKILSHFGVTQDEYSVVFTSGCTASLKLVAESFKFHVDDRLLTSSTGTTAGGSSAPALRRDGEENCEEAGFIYLDDNHTSVIGMREVLTSRGVTSACVTRETVQIQIDGNNSSGTRQTEEKSLRKLFVFPAQSNFSGAKYPLSWIRHVAGCYGNCHVLLDAASHVSTSELDLSRDTPDFVTFSFYKMFGFPTGLGALLVRNDSAELLQKAYFGGGTVQVALAAEDFHAKKTNLSERLEDGTLPFLDILALNHGFDALNNFGGGIRSIQQHTFSLARYLYHQLSSLTHSNGTLLTTLYHTTDYTDSQHQGAIVNFNVHSEDGSFVGFAQVDKLAQAYDIHLRTGCFCNLGACQKSLNISSQTVKDNFKAGHVCGDDLDLIQGRPTGSIRISFGYMSTFNDCQKLLTFLTECFLVGKKPEFSLTVRGTHLSSSPTAVTSSIVFSGTQMTSSLSASESATSSSNTSPELTDISPDLPSVSASDSPPVASFPGMTSSPDMTSSSEFSSDASNQKSKSQIYLSRICVYPVKSCGAMNVKSWGIGPRGLLLDREWMVVTETGVCLSQKREPLMCKIRPHIDLKQKTLTLSFQDMNSISIPLKPARDISSSISLCQSKVCGDRVSSLDCGDDVAAWLQRALRRSGVRLTRQNPRDQRLSKRKEIGESSYLGSRGSLSLANEAQYLLINQTSVQSLNQHLQGHLQDIDSLVDRFRANLIVSGGEAMQEEEWASVKIGQHLFKSQGPCTRCQMICVDQQTGERNKETLIGLTSLKQKKTTFGILLRHQPTANDNATKIEIGNLVTPFTSV